MLAEGFTPLGPAAGALLNRDRHPIVGIGLPDGVDAARNGKRFILGNSAAITGIGPVTALPTTAAQWVLWNADAALSYFFEEIGMYLTSGTPGVGGILLGALVRAPAQVGASVAGASVSSASQSGSASSKMVVKTGVTVTDPAAPNWYPLATNPSSNVTAFAGSTVLEHRFVGGRFMVPPGFGFALAVVAPAGTTPLFAPFAKWLELVG